MKNIILFRYSKILFFLAIIINLFFFFHIPQLRNVEDVDQFVLQDDPDNQFYESFKQVFGNDEFFIIAFTRDSIFTNASLKICRDITDALENIQEIKDVKSLASIDETRGYDDFFEVRKFLPELPLAEDQLKELTSRALSNNLYLKNVISEDARTTAILVELYEKPDDHLYRHRIMAEVHEILSPYKAADIEFHLAGKTVTDTSMSDFMEKDVSLFIPLSYLLMSLCIYYFFRSIKLTLLGILNISCALGSTMGFMGFMDITQNSVTSIVLPLIMALALCDTVHLFSNMTSDTLKKNDFDRVKSMHAACKKILWPCFLTSLTTIIGFLSLYISRIQPIKDFALTSATGIVLVFIFTFFLLPHLIILLDPKKIYRDYHTASFIGQVLDFMSKSVIKFKHAIVFAGIVILLLSVFFLFKIQIETNIMKFFKPDTDIRRDMLHVESNLAGIESFDISLKSTTKEGFKNPENLKIIEDIQTYLSAMEGVEKTISFNDFIKDMNQAFHNEDNTYYRIPENRQLISQYLLLYDSDDIGDYINSAYDHARITARISEHNSSRQKKMLDQVKAYIRTLETPALDIQVTGRVLQDVNVIEDLFWGQIKSLGLALITISAILFLVFRSVYMGLMSLIPNILPILINFGIMGAFGIPLNTATALIAAVAIGVAVDDTIHFMTAYQGHKQTGKTMEDMIQAIIKEKGRAILSSSLILCIGFGVLSFSSFVPTMYFGFLCAIIMFAAAVSDLIILPASLLLSKYKDNITA